MAMPRELLTRRMVRLLEGEKAMHVLNGMDRHELRSLAGIMNQFMTRITGDQINTETDQETLTRQIVNATDTLTIALENEGSINVIDQVFDSFISDNSKGNSQLDAQFTQEWQETHAQKVIRDAPPHFVTAAQLNQYHMHRKNSPKKNRAAGEFLESLMKLPEEFMVPLNDGREAQRRNVVGYYRREMSNGLYCDPAISEYVDAAVTLKEAPAHFVTPAQLNEFHLHRDNAPENSAEVVQLLAKMVALPEDAPIPLNNGKTAPRHTVIGEFRRGSNHGLYCDPAISDHVVNALGITPELPKDRNDLVTYTQFNQKILHREDNADNRTSSYNYAVKMLSRKEEQLTLEGGKSEKIGSLVGIYRNHGKKTVYLSKHLKEHATETLGILPHMEASERSKYISFTDLARKLHGGSAHSANVSGHKNADALRLYLFDLWQNHPDEVVGPEREMTARQAIRRFRTNHGESLYIRKEMLPYIEYNYLAPFPKEEQDQWVTGYAVCRHLHIEDTPARIIAAHELLEKKRKEHRDEEMASPGGEPMKVGDAIRRFATTKKAAYYIRRDALGEDGFINKDMILAQARAVAVRPMVARLSGHDSSWSRSA
jgi:hypothetical protein